MQLSCCPSCNIYASLISLEIKRDKCETNDNGISEHNVAESVASFSPDVTLDMTGSNVEDPHGDNSEIFDFTGATEDETGSNKKGNYRDTSSASYNLSQNQKDTSSAIYNLSINQRDTSSAIYNSSLNHTDTSSAIYTSSLNHRDTSCAIYDCLGATDEQYQRLQPSARDEHIYARPIPGVIRDILAEMPPGMTVEDILRTCVDDRPTECESDDEDPEGNSDYMGGQL